MAQPISDPTIVFLQTIWALDHRLQSHSKRMKSKTGVTGPQRLVLRILSVRPKISPSELARFLFFHKSTVTVVLRSLERGKLVRRRPNPEDRRAVVLELTPAGKRIAAQRSATVESAVRRALAGMPRRDVETAQRVIGGLATALV
jgi:DNA-binding MarR family transcriptional regulator